MLLFELNAWKDEWLVLQEEKKERKEGNNKREEEKEVIEFVNNATMLANWVQIGLARLQIPRELITNFKNYITIYFFTFYVVETCLKFGFWFQILHYSKFSYCG